MWKRLILKTFKVLLILLVVLAAAGFAFYQFHPVFGGQPDEASMAKIRASKAFNGSEFENLEPTPLMTSDESPSILEWGWKMLNPPPGKHPAKPLPTVALDTSQLQDGSVVWFGHSTVLFRTGGQTFITDPVFYRASPVPFTGKPFAMSHVPTVGELPDIDAVLISHDHYDHLDYQAIREINAKAKRFIVPLGVKAHLQRWGIPDSKITEIDWEEQTRVGRVAVTYVPARHFSGRTFERNKTLWGGYVVKSPELSIYFSADSGYGKHFANIIAQHGPFDFAMIENGAYDPAWALIHETPEEAASAVADIGAPLVMPIHWGKFDLANHHWKDPIERFTRAAAERNLQVATSRIGQMFQIGKPPQEKWWADLE
ncbi:multidrug transporter [Eikenella longinqua]|uniref:Multidrug transporter n=1 Tax=Eikenella longinqua TaxID=1795827 RepID=A0A1A9RU11_9NEIS|nr:MBL fold metallo-hydrolase [Eikenella longinqua]OAM26405.1 multidrug transporter [Eikenella longinqua]